MIYNDEHELKEQTPWTWQDFHQSAQAVSSSAKPSPAPAAPAAADGKKAWHFIMGISINGATPKKMVYVCLCHGKSYSIGWFWGTSICQVNSVKRPYAGGWPQIRDIWCLPEKTTASWQQCSGFSSDRNCILFSPRFVNMYRPETD